MGSRLAITEKRPTKSKSFGSVFFQFLDWNKMLSKKKKKLFSSNKLLLPSGSKKFGGDEKMPKAKHFLVADKTVEVPPISQKQTDFSNQMRDPGPVAKLMGLESMPIVHHRKPSKPSLTSEFGSNCYESSEVKESRPQKLQRTGGFLERRQQPAGSSPSEALRLQSSRRVRRQHKSASPMKSPRLFSKRSTGRLMEAATKILEPGLHSRRNHAKCALTYANSSESPETEPKDGIFVKKCKVSLINSLERPPSSFSSLSEGMELGPRHGQEPLKEYNQVESNLKPSVNRTLTPFSQVEADAERALAVSISKCRPASPNVQDMFSVESRSRGPYEKKNCMHYKYNGRNLMQKHLPLAKSKLIDGSKTCMTPSNRSSASDIDRSRCTLSRSASRELNRERVATEKNGLERKNKATKRRSNDDSQSESSKMVSVSLEKRQSARHDLIKGKGKGEVSKHPIKSNPVKSDFKNHVEGNGARSSEGNNIVSFTFSSPMKHASRSLPNEEVLDKQKDMGKLTSNGSCPKKLLSAEKIHGIASQREETLGRDSVSELLKQKTKEVNSFGSDELTAEDAFRGRSTVSILGELISALRPAEEDIPCSGSTNVYDQTISNGEMVVDNGRFKAEPEAGTSDAHLVRNGDGDHPSPMSILDVSFSNDSCFSESPHGASGDKPEFGSSNSHNNIRLLDLVDTDLLDSASSFEIQKCDMEKTPVSIAKNSLHKDISTHLEVLFSESKIGFSAEAKFNASLLIENITNGKDLFIYYTLDAATKALGATEAKDRNQLRWLLLDCMIECLGSLYNGFFASGAKHSLSIKRKMLERAVCKEIEEWNDLAGRGMDEVFRKEMSRSNRTWTKFEIEALEIGVQIENDIVNKLVGEIVIDLCTWK